MKQFISVAVVVLAIVVTGAPVSAAPIVIGNFSWEPADPFLGLGPTFTFENQSGGPLSNFSVELDTDAGLLSFDFLSPLCGDEDADGVDDCVGSPTLPDGTPSQITDDLSLFVISQAFIRSPDRSLFLLDANDTPLLDANGDALGLDGLVLLSARVAYESGPPPPPPPAPIPEPGTLLLVGIGLSGVVARRRYRPGGR